MNYPIDQKLLQELLNYLQTKPYAEVAGFIGAIMTIVKNVDEKPKQVEEVTE